MPEIKIGDRLPPEFLTYIERVILEKEIWGLEQRDEKNKFLLIFKFSGGDYVYICGFDLAFLNEVLYMEKTGETLPIPVPFSGPFKITLDQTAETIASILKAESCKILKVSHKKAESQENFSFEDSAHKKSRKFRKSLEGSFDTLSSSSFQSIKAFNDRASINHSINLSNSDSERGLCKEEFVEEIGSNRQVIKEQNINEPYEVTSEFNGGICVFPESQNTSLIVVTLQTTKSKNFSPEEVCFLRYILSLVSRILECNQVDSKLHDKIHFFEALLTSVPDPSYFKNMSKRAEDYGTVISEGIGNHLEEEFERERFQKDKFEAGPLAQKHALRSEEFKVKIKPKKRGNASKKASEFLNAVRDISGLKEGEETLKIALEVQKVLWTVINNSPAVVFLWRNEENWPADFVSDNISQFGYTVEDFTTKKVLYGSIIHRQDIDRVKTGLNRFVEAGQGGFRSEYRLYTKAGDIRWVDERTFIQRNKAGEVIFFQGVVIDITERKLAEEASRRAELLRKKDLNHRIKNNLQIVSSLLDLQAEKFDSEKVVEAFKESERRILSMSLIHEELYESGKLDSLDFSSYLLKLIQNLLKAYEPESNKIHIHQKVGKIFLGVDTAISLGLIINELLTNSLKHAFSESGCGEINIGLFKEETGTDLDKPLTSTSKLLMTGAESSSTSLNPRSFENFILVFLDNGKGFPEEIDFKNPETLGLQLVHALVEQLEGTLDLEKNRETKFILRFRSESYEAR